MLRTPSLLLAFILPLITVTAQVGFTDDFSDNDFTNNPSWIGESGKFQVSGQILQSNGPAASDTAILVTASADTTSAFWEFDIRLDFPPSNANFAKVYLISDSEKLKGSLNGYFIKIGGVSGSLDDVSLYRQDGTTEVLLIDGIDGIAGSNLDLRISAERNPSGLWQLAVQDLANSGGKVLQGTANDLTHTRSSWFGVFCKFTSSRRDHFFFDNFFVNRQAVGDTTNPEVSSITIPSDDSIRINFTENINLTTARNTSNYLVNKSIGSPLTAKIDQLDSSIVILTFSNNFMNGESYQLKVQNVADRSGNVMNNDSSNFVYLLPAVANYREVVINEFFPDPTPVVGLPNAEYIELYNASNKIFQLANWTISDASSTAALPSYIFRPNEYLIICAATDTSDFQTYGLTTGISSLPSLNNTGDLISLTDDQNRIVDEINYDIDYYNDNSKEEGGYSIEQINPSSSCNGRANFAASINSSGGTPGSQNSVYDLNSDTTAPQLLSAEVLSIDSILLKFNETLDTVSVINSSYTFSGTTSVLFAENQAPDYQNVLLILASPLDSGVINTITVENLSDCPGNLIASDNTAEIVVSGVAAYRNIVINEFLADPTPQIGLPESDFIELYNASSKVFDLNGWQIADLSSTATLSSQIIRPGEYLIICPENARIDYQTFGDVQALRSFPSLNSSGDEIYLFDNEGKLIDFISYNDGTYRSEIKSEGGFTLEQINPELPCNSELNLLASNSPNGGTPGTQNSVFDLSPDVTAPRLVDAFVLSPDSIQLIFNEGLDPISAENADYQFSNGLTVDTVLMIQPSLNSLFLLLNQPLTSGEIINLNLLNISDCSGNKIIKDTKVKLALGEQAEPQDLVINEILFNPRSGGSDFVEIYNRSEKAISLQGWQMANDFSGNPSDEELITDKGFILFPEEYLGLTEDLRNVIKEYPLTRAERFIEVNDLPSYKNDEDTVYVLDFEGTAIDKVIYSEDQHFALLNDNDGVSLERVDPDRASEDPSNFHSASEKVGFATPGYENSQFFTDSRFTGKITIDPETFSPDNDGFQDILNINYKFEAPGFVANITIYDRYGRQIKKLISSELLGGQGTFSWNGITDDGQKARIGIYVILFEAFNPSGAQEEFKKTVVVAGNLD